MEDEDRMASDFEYTGIENHQAGFRESATGMQHCASVDDGSSVELLDGDQVVITSGRVPASGDLAHTTCTAYILPSESAIISIAVLRTACWGSLWEGVGPVEKSAHAIPSTCRDADEDQRTPSC